MTTRLIRGQLGDDHRLLAGVVDELQRRDLVIHAALSILRRSAAFTGSEGSVGVPSAPHTGPPFTDRGFATVPALAGIADLLDAILVA